MVGGGFAAAEESVFLTKYASHITILMRGEDFSCARATADPARNHPKITVVPNVQVECGGRGQRASPAALSRSQNWRGYRIPVLSRVKVLASLSSRGMSRRPSLVKDIAEINEQGYILTDRCQKTSVEGLYAAGDVCVKPLRQVVTAVGDGALAATELEKYAAAMQQKTGLHPQQPVQREEPVRPAAQEDSLFDADVRAQLETVFSRMEQPLRLQLALDSRTVSKELEQYMRAMERMTDKLTVEIVPPDEREGLPCVRVCRQDGSWTGLAFHGAPGGHEFTSFVLGLYNASGPGQALDSQVEQQIRAIDHPVNMKILVSLSCTMCPELVTAAQKMAAINPNITAQVYDLNHFAALKDRYQVMSVPVPGHQRPAGFLR